MASPPLAAGNAVILKPSPESVAVGARIVEQFHRAGVPRDLVQLAPCHDDDAGRRLITHPTVDTLVLTGSYDTAKLFRSWVPERRLFAETSGKNALVISATADVDQAIADLVRSAFGHSGQKCSAASLAILEAPLFDDLPSEPGSATPWSASPSAGAPIPVPSSPRSCRSPATTCAGR
ncbi:MAG: aldehyde dehydrogenase family protein [Ilumatobacteraceae bacterium]